MFRPYLDTYGELETQEYGNVTGNWQHVVVVPSCAEGQSPRFLFDSLERCAVVGRILVVFVVNRNEHSTPEVEASNAETLRLLQNRFKSSKRLFHGKQIDILCVDKTSEGNTLPPKHGVGMARKIGCDIALMLCHQGQILTDWIASTDADAQVPEHYFDVISQPSVSAVSLPFRHTPVDGYENEIALYELSLHHYVLGLQWAGSPYAFHTIGSTIALHTETYAICRGFPKRLAGEDFYMLNKAAKIGPIYRADGDPIILSGRPSSRVPFGTGPAIQNIRKMDAFSMYNPLLFAKLREVLTAFEHGDTVPNVEVLNQLGYPRLVQHLQQQTPKNRHRACMEWFDGFRTLRFLHLNRQQGLPNLDWQSALAQSPWWSGEVPRSPREALAVVRQNLYPTICGSTSRPLCS